MSKVLIGVIVITILGLCGLRKFNPIKLKSISAIVFLICGMLIGILAWNLTNVIVPIPKEKVKVTASVKKSTEEVFITSFLVDGIEIFPSKPVEGNWIKRGTSYGWMSKKRIVVSDLTNIAVFEVPIGVSRKVNFETKENAGRVKIDYHGKIKSKKLKSIENGIQGINIAPTEKNKIYKYKFALLLVYSLLLTLGLSIQSFVYSIWRKEKGPIIAFCIKWKYNISYLILAGVVFVFLEKNAETDPLWFDEVHTLGTAELNLKPNSMFITSMFLRMIKNILPYGQSFLMLPSIIVFVICIYLLGITGKKIKNGKVGLYAAVCLAFSAFAYRQVAFEYRSYFVLLLFSIVTLYLFVSRLCFEKINLWYILGYGASLLMLMDSHEYGKVLVAFFVLLDIVFIIKKKIILVNIVSDFFAIGYGFFWLFNNDVVGLWNNYSWPINPTISDVYNTFLVLCSENVNLVYCFVLGIIIVLTETMLKVYKHKKEIKYTGLEWIVLFLVFGVFTASIVYSNYINPENSLYVNRYFVSVLSYIFIIIGVAIDKIVDYIFYKKNIRFIISLWIVLMIAIQGWQTYVHNPHLTFQDYSGAAEWLREQEDIYNKETLIFVSDYYAASAGWNYLFTHDGEYPLANIKCNDDSVVELKGVEKIYVVKPAHEIYLNWKNVIVKDFTFIEQPQSDNGYYPVYIYIKNNE